MKLSIYLSVLLFVFAFNACEFAKGFEKDDKEHHEDVKDDDDKKVCFEWVFPISVTMPDQSTITGSDEDDFWAQIKNWYELNPNSEQKYTYQYPIEVLYEGEKELNINSDEELLKMKKECLEYGYKDKCFQFVYPLNYLLPDGSTLSINSLEEIKTWYESNPNSDEKLELVYPFEIEFEKDGTVKLVSNEEDFKAAFEYCQY